jgi:hypothetical protein
MRALETVQDVKSAVADYMRQLESGALAPDVGRVLIAGAGLMLQVIREYEFEGRLKELESRVINRPSVPMLPPGYELDVDLRSDDP